MPSEGLRQAPTHARCKGRPDMYCGRPKENAGADRGEGSWGGWERKTLRKKGHFLVHLEMCQMEGKALQGKQQRHRRLTSPGRAREQGQWQEEIKAGRLEKPDR